MSKYTSPFFSLRSNHAIEKMILKLNCDMREYINRNGKMCIDNVQLNFSHGIEPKPKINIHLTPYIENGASGTHNDDTKLICLHQNMKKDGERLFACATHENTHDIQCGLMETRNLYPIDSAEYRYLKKLAICAQNAEREFADIKISGRLYVNASAEISNIDLSDLNFALYKLSVNERFADDMERIALELCGTLIKNQQQAQIQVLRTRYNLINYNDMEIIDMVDCVFEKIHGEHLPNTPIEASLMYDIYAILSYQHGCINKEQYEQISKFSTKSQKLAQLQIQNPDLNIFDMSNMSHSISDPIEAALELDQLSPNDLLNNPRVIAYAVFDFGPDAIQYIPNQDIFQTWCYSVENDFPKDFMDEIAKTLGPEFSGKRCAEEQQKIRDSIKKQEIDERIKNHNPNDMKFETHSHSQEIDGIDINQT